MCSWHTVVARTGPCASPSIMKPQVPQIPSRQSESNAIGSSPFAIRPSLTTSSISRNDMSGLTLSARYSTNLPAAFGPACRQTLRLIRIDIWHSAFVIDRLSLIAPLRRLHVLEVQRLLVQLRRHADAGELPRGGVREMRVVAECLA